MVRIREAVLVEGRYDKNTLLQIVDTAVFVTSGFGIFKNKEQMRLLRKVAQARGLIVFTDSDGAGLVIRNHVKSAIDGKYLKHAYIPDIPGKEKRKSAPGKEGKLGVEGMRPEVILDALYRAGATVEDGDGTESRSGITKPDLVEFGLSGGPDSSLMRRLLLKKIGFPENLSANAMLEALNLLYSVDELAEICRELGN